MLKALLLAGVLNVCAGNPNSDEAKAVESLNAEKNLQIFGDFITIAAKNRTEPSTKNCTPFEEYVHSHVIRIKAPLNPDEYINFELSDFVPEDMPEGRKKRRTGLRDILIPLLMALKYKSTVVLPLFMMFVTVLALKGFWAGMTGMFISKLVALKVLLQSQEKRDDDHEEEEEEEQDDHNSDHPVSYEIPNQNEEEQSDNEKPIVIYLHSDKHGGKFSRRRKEPPLIRRYHNPKNWNPWTRR